MTVPDQREVAERTARRVLDAFAKSSALPGPLVRKIQAAHTRRTGHIPTYEEVEREVRAWVNEWLEQIDKGASPEHAAEG